MPSICDSIKENKQLRLDEKICCGNDDCLNVNTHCYKPDSLVLCHEMSGVDACERRHRISINNENNDGAKKFCKKENSNKHLCISTDSVVNSPNRNAELIWVVSRPFGGYNTEFGASCQTCICCYGNNCTRIYGLDTSCTEGCPIHNLTMLNRKCSTIFERKPIESIKVGDCSDMFMPGSCQFYNLSTGSPLNETINFQPQLCDFTVKHPLLDYGDKIAVAISIGLGAPGFVLTVIAAYLSWKQYKLEERREKAIEMRNGQQSQAQENQSPMINVENVEAESQTDKTLNNNSRIQLSPEQKNEEDQVQEP